MERFGRWLVLEKINSRMWLCRCDCGTEKTVAPSNLRAGKSVSCGCFKERSHGMHLTRTYRTWASMCDRVRNPNNHAYARYSKLGMCERWQTFSNFLADMGEKPDGLSIDRIDNERGYWPDNCRWATQKQQTENRRVSLFLSFQGERKTIGDWARDERCAVSMPTLYQRYHRGWPDDKAITAPPHRGSRL